MRILLAEDERVSRAKLEHVLKQWGYRAICVPDGGAAWETLQRADSPRLALLDWLMPGMDGIEICRRVRALENRPYVYVMLLTQKSGQDDIVAGLNAGADDYLIKPVNPAELYGRLRAGRRVLEAQNELLRMREELTRQALYDPLTRSLNRRGGLLALRRELGRTARTKGRVSVALCSLDGFAELGRENREPVQREAARRMDGVLRPYDVHCRYGEGEFLLVLPDCDEDRARAVVQRCRAALTEAPVDVPEGRLDLAACFGLCASGWREGLKAEDLIVAADGALHRARKAGAGRVEFAAPPAPQADGPD